eukprot:TRINITY_DN553_c0_g5_i1.p2 TRINITY_DN553_c0_g5~~TRINITY_DN553_c0_g5_i1.p2  ORF type:complete len:110 (-),score=3.37 TRINITY_DN553_c0_g5_i1:209-538(-)
MREEGGLGHFAPLDVGLLADQLCVLVFLFFLFALLLLLYLRSLLLLVVAGLVITALGSGCHRRLCVGLLRRLHVGLFRRLVASRNGVASRPLLRHPHRGATLLSSLLRQ